MHITSQPVPVTRKTSFSGTIVEIVFLVVLSVICFFYLVSPKQTAYSATRTELEALQKKQAELQKQQEAFDALVQEFEQNTEAVSTLEQILPQDAKPSKLYVLLENFMQSSGLVTGSVSVNTDSLVVVAGNKDAKDATSEQVGYKATPADISVSAVGTIDQLTNFLHLVETSTRLLEVKNLDVSQGRGDQVVFKIGLQAYSYAKERAK